MLTVPTPQLPGPTTPLAKPLVLKIQDVKLSDGTPAGEGDVASAGVFVLRGSPGAAEFFDESQKSWRAVASDEALKELQPTVAVFKGGAWEATFVGIGKKDAGDADAFAVASGGAPTYFVRALVKAKAGPQDSALSAPSAAFTFIDEAANSRFVTQFDTPGTKPDAAHKVRMQLKGDALQAAGYLEIRAQPSFELEIANCDAAGNVLAKVLLLASGEIRLTPAAGSKVIIEGDAETQRIFYAPDGGGAKRWLT